MQLRETRYTLQIARLATNAGGIVMQIDIESRCAKYWRQRSNKPVNQMQSRNICAGFNVAIVVSREEMETFPRT